jgi:glycosyltransferase involved in cell wall biosynthesis
MNRELYVHAVPVDPYRHVNLPQVAKFASPIPLAFWPSRILQNTVNELAKASWDAVVAIQVPVARYALQLPKVPRVLDVDTALSYQMWERYKAEASPLRRLQAWASWQKARRYESWILRRYGACTVVSDTEVEHLRALVMDTDCQVEVCPNGVDCDHYQPGLALPVKSTLVYNGALTYSANYDAVAYFLERIYSTVRHLVPEATLTITGSTSGVDLSSLPLDESVRLSGYVEDVRPLVSQSWACVTPIRKGGGTRLKILEAMALGTPVISTSKGAEGLDVTPEQHILIADNPEQFAAQVVRLLRDPDLRRRLSRHARNLVEKYYDWTRIGQRFVELVESTSRKQRSEA